MGEFKYRAVDNRNRPVEGVLQAESPTEVVDRLQQDGLRVTAVDPVEPAPWGYPRKDRLSGEDLTLFNEQLSAIVKSGLPLGPSLEALGHDVQSRRLRRVIAALKADLEAGQSLSEALARHPGAFSPMYVALVRAGEEAGNLSASLEVLTAQSEQGVNLKYRVQEAVAYPLLVMGLALVILFYFLSRAGGVVDVTGALGGGGAPSLIKTILKAGRGLNEHWQGMAAALVVITALIVAAVKLIGRNPRGRYGLDALKLRLPLYGRLLRDAAAARFARALGMLLAGRVPLPESLRMAAVASGNAVMRDYVREAAAKVESGRQLSASLDETGVFPETFLWLLRTGENRGVADSALLELAQSYERSAARRSRLIATGVGPAMTIAAAFVIVLLMVVVYQPMLAVFFGGF